MDYLLTESLKEEISILEDKDSLKKRALLWVNLVKNKANIFNKPPAQFANTPLLALNESKYNF